MLDENEMENLANGKYAYLLQPIRDLAVNFKFDIEKLLDDYVATLPEQENTNFVEAAMLLQGSTAVYSRKVDYVYNLVLNAITNLMAERNKKKKGDEDGETELNLETSDPCELVDFAHMLRPAKNIALPPGKCVILPDDRVRQRQMTMPIQPISLVPFADFEKVNVPLVSRRNNKEIIGKKDDFRINTAHVHKLGALLLDLINEDLMDEITDFPEQTTGHTQTRNFFKAVNGTADKENVPPNAVEGRFDAADDYDIGGDEDAASHFGDFARDGTPATGAFTDANRDGVMRPSCTQLQDIGNRLSTATGIEPVKKEEPIDFDFLDEFENNDWRMAEVKPIRPCIYAEDILKKRMRAAAKLAGKPEAAKKWELDRCMLRPALFVAEPQLPLRKYIEQAIYRRRDPKREHVVPIKSVDAKPGPLDFWLTHSTVAAVYRYQLDRQRERTKRRREANALMAKRKPGTNLTAVRRPSRAALPPERLPAAPVGDYDDDDFFGGGGNDEDDMDPELQALDDQRAQDEAGVGGLAGELSDRDLEGRIPSSLFGDIDGAGQLDSEGRPIAEMSYEEQLTHYLKRYWSNAEEKTSAFCQRVLRWEDRMLPILEAEQRRREFDIKRYGTELINGFNGTIGGKRRFANLIPATEKFEICRYFLSSLMLANTYNLNVADDTIAMDRSVAVNQMELTLLNEVLPEQNFE